MKRFTDIVVSVLVLLIGLPLFFIAAFGIKLSSPGPVFYPANRIGLEGRIFRMFKFRSMHYDTQGTAITSQNDPRVFRWGNVIRKLKLDELPQFYNVLVGDMTIVGPRPEDPSIVQNAYADWMLETLSVKPGITSPGAIFYYGYGEKMIDAADPEGSYIEKILPAKLAIERAYLERATFGSDLRVILDTTFAILAILTRRKVKLDKENFLAAEQWIDIQTLQDVT